MKVLPSRVPSTFIYGLCQGKLGPQAGVTKLLIKSEAFGKFLRFSGQNSGQRPERGSGEVRVCLLSCLTGVLPAGGGHASPSPGARKTPGCGHSAGRGEAGPWVGQAGGENPPMFQRPGSLTVGSAHGYGGLWGPHFHLPCQALHPIHNPIGWVLALALFH